MRTQLHFTSLKKSILLPFLLFAAFAADAQYKISGTVINPKGKPVRGANVYLDNTIDGGTTDSLGIFRFTTSETGNQTIIATEVGHENAGLPIVIIADMSGIVITIKDAPHDLDVVVITAGSFDASNDKTKTVLKPLDIVTSAGANADVVKAITMLPGTQQVGTDNGLFVRGGDASEAGIVVDEMVVQNAFFSGPPGVATRSRFGAFNYQGVSFSSGGYSARYGQALSSILELTTTDIADKSTVNMGANLAGVYASGTKKWKNSSLDVGGGYNNTKPFFELAKTNMKFYEPPSGGSGNLRYVWKPNKDGIFKASFNVTNGVSGITIPNPYTGSVDSPINFHTNNTNYYSNVSYKQMCKHKYMLYTAASYSLDQNRNRFSSVPIDQDEHRAQYRIEGKDFFTSRLNVLVGGEIQNFGIKNTYNSTYKREFTENIIAGYAEMEWTPINRIAFKPGVRYEHSTYLEVDRVAPRMAMAIKTSTHGQVSLAGGVFYQNPDNSYLLAGLKQANRPDMQNAVHYIANWQWAKDDRLIRIEGYYKQYNDLVREMNAGYDGNTYRIITDTSLLNNSGHGYAQGLELFYRDKKTVKNLDYWVSYSYIDTRRLYSNYPGNTLVTPSFIANHNLSLVSKYFIDKLHTSVSATYSYASGRPYYDPNKPKSEFLSDRTPDFNNVAFSAAWLHTFGKWFTVFYVSIDNVTNNKNVFGYRYQSDALGNPTQTRTAVVPALYRSIFFGINMSLTQFSKDEL